MIDIKDFWRPLAPCLFTCRVYTTSFIVYVMMRLVVQNICKKKSPYETSGSQYFDISLGSYREWTNARVNLTSSKSLKLKRIARFLVG